MYNWDSTRIFGKTRKNYDRMYEAKASARLLELANTRSRDFPHSQRFQEKNKIPARAVKEVEDLYLQAVSYGIPHTFGDKVHDPFLASSCDGLRERKRKIKKDLKNRKDRYGIKPYVNVSSHIKEMFYGSSETDQRRILSMLEFDVKNAKIDWRTCGICRKTYLYTLGYNKKKNKKICVECSKAKHGEAEHGKLLTGNYLPVWYDEEGKVQYHVPLELQGLTLGEKLLIQKNSTLLPLVHVYNGRLGFHGNSVSFSKEMNTICNELPRLKAEIVIVVKQYHDVKRGAQKNQHFKIRRRKVLDALRWLARNHKGYSDVVINESNLEWVGDSGESYLSEKTVSLYQKHDIHSDMEEKDTHVETVAAKQTEIDNQSGTILHTGVTSNTLPRWVENGDRDVVNELQKVTEGESSVKCHQFEFPHIAQEPLNEFSEELLMANTYPWLFPGGLGDRSGVAAGRGGDKNIRRWTDILMRWHDGRFMRDDMFSFHMNNYIQRHLNNSSGLTFIKQFIEDSSISIYDIKKQIERGDKAFISKLQYFGASKTRGSDAYWRQMKHDVNEWISYHLKEGNGPPTLFLTFSCAEYWWSDLEKLLVERCKGTEDENLANKMVNGGNLNEKKRAKSIIVERYSAVVQEFFQWKMDNWLKTVGEKEFGIEHYWMRFEFAKGRGTIHSHILAITRDAHITKSFSEAFQKSREDATKIISKYARDTLTMTAEKPGLRKRAPPDRVNPLCTPYCTIISDEDDKYDLVENVHMHMCNKFCLRFPRWG